MVGDTRYCGCCEVVVGSGSGVEVRVSDGSGTLSVVVLDGAGVEVRLSSPSSVAVELDDEVLEDDESDDEESLGDDSSDDELLVDDEDELEVPGSFEPSSPLKRLMHPPMRARRSTPMMTQPTPVLALLLPTAGADRLRFAVALGSLTGSARVAEFEESGASVPKRPRGPAVG